MTSTVSRRNLGLRRKHLDEMQAFWTASMRTRVAGLGEPGGGTGRLITDNEYVGWRAFLLPREAAFRDEVLATVQPGVYGAVSDPIIEEGLQLLHQAVRHPSLSEFMRWILAGGTSQMHSAIHRAAQVDAMLVRYRAALDDLERQLPHPVMEFFSGAGRAIDRSATWIEHHPKTLLALGVMAATILLLLGVVTPAVLSAIADLIRAARGQ